MNKKNTKRALLTSVLSLAVCGSMLVGTTFAWFTDSVSSVNNVITTGNLDVKVEYTLDGEEWKDLDGAKDLFQKGLWEPGHTEVVALKIKNEGTLALKYAANMNLIDETVGTNKDGEDIVLSDILTVSTLLVGTDDRELLPGMGTLTDMTIAKAFEGDGVLYYETTSSFKAGNVLRNDCDLAPGDTEYIFVKVDMADTVGNEANAKDKDSVPSIEFGINVMATQFAYENDSFGNDYDVNATYTTEDSIKNANGYVVVANDVALKEAKTELKKTATLNLNGKTISATRSYESGMNAAQISTLAVCNDVTLTGNGTVINNGVGYGIVVRDGGDLVIENGYYYGTTSAVQVSEGTLEIKGGHFEDLSKEDNGHYLINCIDGNYKAGKASVVITGGTFVNWNPAANTSEGKGTNFVPDGYKVVAETKANNDIWYTVEQVVEEVETVESFKSALENGATTVVLKNNVDFEGETVALADGVKIVGGTVNNATFTVADTQTASFEDVEFTGATTVQAQSDGALTFTGCDFNIEPAKLANNSRAAAIIGSNQYNTVDVKLEGCTFNYEASSADTYNMAIFMWSSVKNVEIKNCVFNGYGFVAVKFMNVEEGANIVFEGNTFNMSAKGSANYWYNCAVQIVPQHDKAFTVTFKNNTFTGDYQTRGDLADEFGFDVNDTTPVVAEVAVMHYGSLSNVTVNVEGNTLNGEVLTLDNIAVKKA